MQAYTSMLKTLYSTGQEYIFGATERKKEPIVKIDKALTIYEAKTFNESRVDPKKCIATLAKLIYLFNQKEKFSQAQTTTLFFSITKLLQNEDAYLRRIVYLLIKQLRHEPSIYIVTSSLLKDIHHKDCNFKRNALRTLPLVLDPSNLVQVERYIKGLMNDTDPGVNSAALLAGLQMFQKNEEIVKKWGVEVLEKVKSRDEYVQYHALTLVGEIKKKDVKFLKKSLEDLMKEMPSGLAGIQHLRMLNLSMRDFEYDSPEVKQFINFVLKQVRNKDDSVVMEAAKIACQSSYFSNKDLLDVVKVLQKFLVSESTTKKYTVLKLYNSLLKNSSRKSLVVNVSEIEKVLKDKNVSLSSTAASILLRICSQNYLQKLLKELCKTMSEMSTDYKIDIIKSLENVLRAYPKQYKVINEFLLIVLSNQDAEEIKRQAIQVMGYEIVNISGQAKKQCIRELAKYLGSAKYEKIHFQILGIISREIKPEDVTSDLLKSIIHEIYLQEGSIKACGLSTLIKIAQISEDKRKILQRTIAKFEKDKDQEVRERILFRTTEKPLSSYELDMIQNYLFYNCEKIQASTDASLLNFGSIKKWGEEVGPTILKKKKKSAVKAEEKAKQYEEEENHYKELFLNHSAFKEYGTLRKINQRIQISDPESELNASVRLFLFDEHLVAEYEIENRHESATLENVKVEISHSGEEFITEHVIPVKAIPKGGKGACYVGLAKNQESEEMLPEQSINSIVKYMVKEYSGEAVKAAYDDEFSLQSFEIKLATYMSNWMMESSDFEVEWKKIDSEQESGTYQLNYASKQAAIQELKKKYGMTEIINEEVKNSNKINFCLAGRYLGAYKTLMKCLIGFDTKLGCVVKITVISEKEELSEELVNSLQ